jgi:hypothetical protein
MRQAMSTFNQPARRALRLAPAHLAVARDKPIGQAQPGLSAACPLAHDPEKSYPRESSRNPRLQTFRLFGQDHAQSKNRERDAILSERIALLYHYRWGGSFAGRQTLDRSTRNASTAFRRRQSPASVVVSAVLIGRIVHLDVGASPTAAARGSRSRDQRRVIRFVGHDGPGRKQ